MAFYFIGGGRGIMGKEILFDNEGVILKLNGVTGLLAFKLKLKCLITRSRVSMLTILMLHNGCFVCLEHQFLLSIFLKEVLNMLTNGTFSLMKIESLS